MRKMRFYTFYNFLKLLLRLLYRKISFDTRAKDDSTLVLESILSHLHRNILLFCLRWEASANVNTQTHYDLIVLPLLVIDAATTTHGHHRGEHDGEATAVVQFKRYSNYSSIKNCECGLLHFFHINWIGIILHKVNITIFLINLLSVNKFIQDTKYS